MVLSMSIEIQPYKDDTNSEIMQLLLSADPNKESVQSYLKVATLLAATDRDRVVGVAAIVIAGKEAELKNLAVSPARQGNGIAKQLIAEVVRNARSVGAKTLVVGTGNSSLAQLALYQKCGFRISAVIPDYFITYPEPIHENGIGCMDMIQLRLML